MPLIDWNPSLSVNVKQFDDQHIKLAGMVNTLHEAMKIGQGAKELGKILDDLISYTSTHFSDEERNMETYRYPGVAAHKAEHAELVKQVLDLQKRYIAGETVLLSINMMKFLKDWLVKHIQGDDKLLGEFLNSKGVH
ncbi:MAG: bacteriohemerythrin [Desulfuromonadales bacterium]